MNSSQTWGCNLYFSKKIKLLLLRPKIQQIHVWGLKNTKTKKD